MGGLVNLVGRVSSRVLILPWNRCWKQNQGSTEFCHTLGWSGFIAMSLGRFVMPKCRFQVNRFPNAID